MLRVYTFTVIFSNCNWIEVPIVTEMHNVGISSLVPATFSIGARKECMLGVYTVTVILSNCNWIGVPIVTEVHNVGNLSLVTVIFTIGGKKMDAC